jgi:hypothetical protein
VTKSLHIGTGVALPLDAITRTFGVLAQKGAGKSYLASVLVEEMIAHALHVVILDPTGAWWGLRSSADGKSAGLPITILGGQHGDLPLEATAGAIVADLVVDERVSMVLDLSAFSLSEQRRFVTDFAQRLFHRNTEPLHLVLDEADEFCPQRIPHGHEPMVGAIDRIVRRGRIKGLGVTMISQRAAVIHKDILTQIDTLIVLRTTGPQDRAAIDAWVSQNGTPQQRTELLDSLSSLPTGTAWVWSPSWLQTFRRVEVRARRTFDSSATPKVGQSARAPRVLASVDLEQVRARMAATIEKAKADDPKHLHRVIAELRAAPAKEITVQHVPMLPDGFMNELSAVVRQMGQIEETVTRLRVDLGRLSDRALAVVSAPLGTPSKLPRTATNTLTRHEPTREERRRSITNPTPVEGKLAGGERKILTALAQYPNGRTRSQIAILTGYAVNGGGFGNYLSALRTRGLLDGDNECLKITLQGIEALGEYDPLPTGQALLDHWTARLGRAERGVLHALAVVHPGTLTKEEIAAQTGYEASGGGFGNALSRLRTLELISGRDRLRASDALFDGGAR